MRRLSSASIIVWGLLSLGFSMLPASANWQFTRWGMTPAEVAAASKGSVIESTGSPGEAIKGYTIGDTGSYELGSYHFDAVFYFDQSGLTMIRLKMDPAGEDACLALMADMEGSYGKPFDLNNIFDIRGDIWHDTKSNNAVWVTIRDRTACDLQYRPLVTPSAKGL